MSSINRPKDETIAALNFIRDAVHISDAHGCGWASVLVCLMLFMAFGDRYCIGQGMGSSVHRPPGNARKIPPPDTGISLEDIAASAGLDFKQVSGEPLHKKFLLESIGGGVAVFDYDGDGLEDIFLVNAKSWNSALKPVSRLYRNIGNYRFKDVTEQAGIAYTGWGQGACAGDYDNDGHEDLFVTYYGHNILYHNDGNGHFTDVTARAGLPTHGTRWGTGCSFVDYDRDGRLDIAVANYVSFDFQTVPLPGGTPVCQFKELPVVCGPRGLAGGKNILYHNQGDGTFKDVSVSSHFDQPSGHYGFSVITGDFDEDGWPDIFIACDSTPNILLHNNHDGTFTDIAIPSGVAFNDDGEEQASMGADAADYNHTGHLSLITTTFDDDVPALFANDGKNSFNDVYLQAGLGFRTHQVGWGVAFLDLDNDGWQDVFMVNGHVYPNVDSLHRESHYKEEKTVYYNLKDGTFADITDRTGTGAKIQSAARGMAYGDFANNGSLGIVINNLDSSPNLLVNRGPVGHWLTVKLVGVKSNRDAVGAQVTVSAGSITQKNEVRSGCCFLSQSDMRLHFGLGKAVKVDSLDVRWPSGKRERFSIEGIDRIVELKEGSGTLLHDTEKEISVAGK